jgi:hypothetical protein
MPSHAPKSLLRRTGPTILVSFTAVGLLYSYLVTSKAPLRTPGVRNIERAYSAGGGTSTHTPAHGHGPDGLSRKERAQGAMDGLVNEGKIIPEGPQRDDVGDDQRPVQVSP